MYENLNKNEQVHKKKFEAFLFENYEAKKFNKSQVLTIAKGEFYLDYLLNKIKVTAKEKFKIKKRKFQVVHDSESKPRLAQEVTIKDNHKLENKVLNVVFYEDFFTIIRKIHLEVGHCGINKTEYAISMRFALIPRSVINKYCNLFIFLFILGQSFCVKCNT